MAEDDGDGPAEAGAGVPLPGPDGGARDEAEEEDSDVRVLPEGLRVAGAPGDGREVRQNAEEGVDACVGRVGLRARVREGRGDHFEEGGQLHRGARLVPPRAPVPPRGHELRRGREVHGAWRGPGRRRDEGGNWCSRGQKMAGRKLGFMGANGLQGARRAPAGVRAITARPSGAREGGAREGAAVVVVGKVWEECGCWAGVHTTSGGPSLPGAVRMAH